VFAAIGFFAGLAADGIELLEKAYGWVSPSIEPPDTSLEYWILGQYFFEPGPGYPSGYEDYFKSRPNTVIFGTESLYEFRDEVLSSFQTPVWEAFTPFSATDNDYSALSEADRRLVESTIESVIRLAQLEEGAFGALSPGDMYTLSITNTSEEVIDSVSVRGYRANFWPEPVVFSLPPGVSPSEFRLSELCLEYQEFGDWRCIVEGVTWEEVELEGPGLRPGQTMIVPLFSMLDLETFSDEATAISGEPSNTFQFGIGEVFIASGYSVTKSWRTFNLDTIRPVFGTFHLTPGFDVRSGA
jgi:hypothetical protein